MVRSYKAFGVTMIATLVFAGPVAAEPTQPVKQFRVIRPGTLAVSTLLPPPAARGSEEEAQELAYLHALVAATPAARMEQARQDDAVESPLIFNDVVGTDLRKLPATWALLETVENDVEVAADDAKVRFARIRPWGVDPSLPNCDAGKGKKPTRSYPSGHALLGYSSGYILAQMMPNKAPAILAKARDYALSRQICGVHFPSDTEASHVLGSIVAERIFAAPAAAARISAARAELVTFDKN